ncbi:hypothetical protein BV22DRAFT_1034505 [Leucogyrophana mollusca]|uniref:Uncharacterized protein n=1 Tax=Leucogyrophana mollusca TaxID=85980 RepID=A0ACB8BI02_9AGAM|nr:hypothetical protein BV22DRAFT_1034505 [Leucogyrophana mollusca]
MRCDTNYAFTQIPPLDLEIPTSLSELLTTNFVPNEFQTRDIQNLIEQKKKHVERIKISLEERQKELAAVILEAIRLQKVVSETEKSQAIVESLIAELRATSAPVKRMPPEVMSHVFEHCLPERCNSANDLYNRRGTRHLAPVLLGRVCSSWRTISQRSPHLWCDLSLAIRERGDVDDEYTHKVTIPKLLTWLRNSGSLPMSLLLHLRFRRPSAALTSVLNTVTAHAARWSTLCIEVENSQMVFRAIAEMFQKPFPSLTFLKILDSGCKSYSDADHGTDATPIVFRLDSSPLRKLRLSLDGLDVGHSCARWALITHLSFYAGWTGQASPVTSYLAILAQCSSLESCVLTLEVIDDIPASQPIVLPQLQSLHLRFLEDVGENSVVVYFLGSLTTPRLRVLIIHDLGIVNEVEYHRELEVFLSRNANTLKEFTFTCSSEFYGPEDFAGLLLAAPLLTHLTVQLFRGHSLLPLIHALTPQFVSGEVVCLLPLLESVCVQWDCVETVEKISEMAEMRCAVEGPIHGVAQLRQLTSTPTRKNKGTFLVRMSLQSPADRLAQFRSRGLNVDFLEISRSSYEFASRQQSPW